jgi:hypothetical protein
MDVRRHDAGLAAAGPNLPADVALDQPFQGAVTVASEDVGLAVAMAVECRSMRVGAALPSELRQIDNRGEVPMVLVGDLRRVN